MFGGRLRRGRRRSTAIDTFTNTHGVRFGLALHIGEVFYGNIGSGNRLDFTCIGPAVNPAARLEKLAAGLGRTIILSADFAQQSRVDLEPLGEFTVGDFAAAQRAFGLPTRSTVSQPAERSISFGSDKQGYRRQFGKSVFVLADVLPTAPAMGVKRTWLPHRKMSANDPKRT